MSELANTTLSVGYSDGSGAEDTLLMGGEAVLKAHWGCSCCDRPATGMDTAIVTRAAACWNAMRGVSDPEKAVQAAREALEKWERYFSKLDRDSEPGDRLIDIRRKFHGTRMEATRAALALLTVPAGAPTARALNEASIDRTQGNAP